MLYSDYYIVVIMF